MADVVNAQVASPDPTEQPEPVDLGSAYAVVRDDQFALESHKQYTPLVVGDVNHLLASLQSSGILSGRDALLASLTLLQTGHDRLATRNTYSVVFERHESVRGEMQHPETIQLKMRHNPLSVYMKWMNVDVGREVLYVTDRFDGCLLLRMGGLKGRILPSLKLDPYGSRAMSRSRYPVTECGLLHLCRKLIGFRRSDLVDNKRIDCEIRSSAVGDGRQSYLMQLEYTDRSQSTIYRKTRMHIDRETLLPVRIWNYTWDNDLSPLSEKNTLIEYYQFTNLVFDQELADIDFDSTNSNYQFAR